MDLKKTGFFLIKLLRKKPDTTSWSYGIARSKSFPHLMHFAWKSFTATRTLVHPHDHFLSFDFPFGLLIGGILIRPLESVRWFITMPCLFKMKAKGCWGGRSDQL